MSKVTNKDYVEWITMFKAAVEQSYKLKGQLRQDVKQLHNQYINIGNSLIRLIEARTKLAPEGLEIMEELSGYYHDVIFEAGKAGNKAELLAVIRAYNAGEIAIQDLKQIA